jgi:hypothetical protein
LTASAGNSSRRGFTSRRHRAGHLNNLSAIINGEQWADFRSYVAHLWNEKQNLDLVLAETEQLLRNTFGYGVLQARSDDRKARALLDATKAYARNLAAHPENAEFADSTGLERLGQRFAGWVASPDDVGRPQIGREFLMALRDGDWDQARPAQAIMSGADYRAVWARLSGEAINS